MLIHYAFSSTDIFHTHANTKFEDEKKRKRKPPKLQWRYAGIDSHVTHS